MRCPSCSHLESKVVDSRSNDDSTSIRRRRECLKCGTRFTTYERLGENPMIVIKSDGSSEAYSRDKLFRGILVACAKRPVSADAISSIIDDIEVEIRKHPKCEIGSKELGDMVVERLGQLDVVAYVRFASVYKDYQDIEEFMGALDALQKKNQD
ncbi:MAG: transcriptional regulator NrdR [Coriobacteriia bacterium]|nr:transcriptional regulator NrdR [Coriobacteriia bacterium]